ncbi:MAG: hypothetical protein LBE48_06170 [Methanomassiliicoccaceae archaeon]|jgi:hypothetical protein|nr:hypothetical protein [Methanomassiliicoccaceae archaeon]
MDSITFATVTIIALSVVLVVLFLILRVKNDMRTVSRRKIKKRSGKKASEDICGICFGKILKSEMIARCGCGNEFHDTCAEPVGTCPYCGCGYGSFEKDMPDYVTCPSCGSDVTGTVCECGAVINHDGVFTCGCGAELDVNHPVCKKCGKEYDVCSGKRT